jgi:carbon starvation protein
MQTLFVALASFVGFIVAYHTYGRWLARKIFRLDPARKVPSETQADGRDFVPTRRAVVFGHHFTSIAGTGPIVGPAIAVFWGWLPALLWVLLGSVFIGAVHDFGALVVSLRSRGQTIGEAAGDAISPRARLLFLLILLFELTIVLAVFGLVIASIFSLYPESVLSIWLQIPIAVAVGVWVHRRTGSIVLPALLALAGMYVTIWLGTHLPLNLAAILPAGPGASPWLSPVAVWTILLLAYVFIASVLPVWVLLQPRDYINSNQLYVAMGLLIAGLMVAATRGQADLSSAPAVATGGQVPADAPPLWPFLFITVACGAVSGFHCLVSSGTSSKQLRNEADAQSVGYGSMLLEGALAVLVIFACCAGVGMGTLEKLDDPAAAGGYDWREVRADDGSKLTGERAWREAYPLKTAPDGRTVGWRMPLGKKLGAFVEGGANFLSALGIPFKLGVGVLAVLLASFASTTLDTAARLQRYVLQELGETVHFRPLTNRYVATAVAVALGGALALLSGRAPGLGGMVLWPLFGATNQLLAGLAFLVIATWLLRRGRPVWFLLPPAALMVVFPAWAMIEQIFGPDHWLDRKDWLLLGIAVCTQGLTAWMLLEAALIWRRFRKDPARQMRSEDAA